MTKKEKVKNLLSLLDLNYPTDNKCYLDHENAWQLLIATILSAQCTDARVNIVTKNLFLKYKSIKDFANANLDDLMLDIKTTGFFRNKSKNIIECCKKLISDYDGEVPSDIDELLKLKGVGRKTANVVRGHIFNIPSIVVDTHVKRVTKRIGLTKSEDPTKIEFELMKILPKSSWIKYNTQIIAHGRKICTARNSKCEICFLYDLCDNVRIK